MKETTITGEHVREILRIFYLGQLAQFDAYPPKYKDVEAKRRRSTATAVLYDIEGRPTDVGWLAEVWRIVSAQGSYEAAMEAHAVKGIG